MADQDAIRFNPQHNQAAYLFNPPEAHREFKSLIDGLNTCRISHALRETPVIYKDQIYSFWSTATLNQGRNAIWAIIQGKEIEISEADIRKALILEDLPTHTTFYPRAQVIEVLPRMSYEGNYPPIEKKLLHPYWRLLAHTFLVCMSSNKGGGINALNMTQSSAFVALAMDWDYNYSRYIFLDMLENLKTKKDKFLLYPRFIQMVLNDKYPDLEPTIETLDIKSMGPSTFGLMKQSRTGAKVTFQGNIPLEKFGRFIETDDEPANIHAIVAEEQEPVVIEEEQIGEENADPLDTVTSASQTGAPVISIPTVEQLAALLSSLQEQTKMPPSGSTSEIPQPSEEEVDLYADLVPRKRRRRDPRPAVTPISTQSEPTPSEPMATESSTPLPAHVDIPPQHISTDSTILSPMIQSPPRHLDVVTEPSSSSHQGQGSGFDMEKFLALQEEYKRAEKGKSINTEGDFEDDVEDVNVNRLQQRVFVLEQDSIIKDIRIKELEKVIKTLETNMGQMSEMYSNLIEKLKRKYPNDFAEDSATTTHDSVAQPESIETQVYESQSEREEAMEKFRAGETGFRISAAKFRELVVMRNQVIQKEKEAQKFKPTRFWFNTEDSRFNYEGDRSGIVCWGYDDIKEMWWVRRRGSRRIEYYDEINKFQSFTSVDLSELSVRSFYNPSGSHRGSRFYDALQRSAKESFVDRTMAKSIVVPKTTNSLGHPIDPPLVEVKWPATDWIKEVPILPDLPEGTLNKFKFWTFDKRFHGVIINCEDREYCFYDPVDLMSFCEKDIRFLCDQKMKVQRNCIPAATEFVNFARLIVKHKAWSGITESQSTVVIQATKEQEDMPQDKED